MLQRLQAGGPKLSTSDLSRTARDKLASFYAEDYRIYGAWFET